MNSLGFDDHQVAVERQGGRLAQAFDHRRADGDVGNEVAVHHVHVYHRAAAPLSRGNLIRQMGEICRQYGWEQLNHGFFRRASCRASVSAETGRSLRAALMLSGSVADE